MIAGWHQWADAGNVSSGLPRYLIEQTHARKPHQNEELYAEAFFNVVESFAIKRVAVVAGVYGPVPYEKDRDISCVYSLPRMKKELARYAVRFSNYEGGATIGTYLVDKAGLKEIEFVALYAFVPSYEFSSSSIAAQPVAIGEDYKAWYDLMVRLNHMFSLDMDLSELGRRGEELTSAWDSQMEHLARTMPRLEVESYMEEVRSDFTERPFVPLGDVWEEGLEGLFEDDEE